MEPQKTPIQKIALNSKCKLEQEKQSWGASNFLISKYAAKLQ
jgi:hypothetical protein